MNDEQVVTPVTINVDKVVDRIMATKKVKISKNEVKETVEKYAAYVEYFNSLKELIEVVWDNVPLERVQVLNELKDFVMPCAIRYDVTDRKTKDLLVRGTAAEYGSYEDFVNVTDTIRGYFKADASSNVTSLSALKKAVNLNDIISRCCVDGKVAYYGAPFVPVHIEGIKSLFESRYFNSTIKEVMSDYYSNLRFNS